MLYKNRACSRSYGRQVTLPVLMSAEKKRRYSLQGDIPGGCGKPLAYTLNLLRFATTQGAIMILPIETGPPTKGAGEAPYCLQLSMRASMREPLPAWRSPCILEGVAKQDTLIPTVDLLKGWRQNPWVQARLYPLLYRQRLEA